MRLYRIWFKTLFGLVVVVAAVASGCGAESTVENESGGSSTSVPGDGQDTEEPTPTPQFLPAEIVLPIEAHPDENFDQESPGRAYVDPAAKCPFFEHGFGYEGRVSVLVADPGSEVVVEYGAMFVVGPRIPDPLPIDGSELSVRGVPREAEPSEEGVRSGCLSGEATATLGRY